MAVAQLQWSVLVSDVWSSSRVAMAAVESNSNPRMAVAVVEEEEEEAEEGNESVVSARSS